MGGLQRLHSPRLAAPRFAYSPCVRQGGLGWVSGMVAQDPASGRLIEGGVAAQARRIFDNLALALPDYGFDWAELALVRVYLCDFSAFAEFNQVWEETLRDRPWPARTSLGVTALPLGAAIEIEFMFVQAAPTGRP